MWGRAGSKRGRSPAHGASRDTERVEAVQRHPLTDPKRHPDCRHPVRSVSWFPRAELYGVAPRPVRSVRSQRQHRRSGEGARWLEAWSLRATRAFRAARVDAGCRAMGGAVGCCALDTTSSVVPDSCPARCSVAYRLVNRGRPGGRSGGDTCRPTGRDCAPPAARSRRGALGLGPYQRRARTTARTSRVRGDHDPGPAVPRRPIPLTEKDRRPREGVTADSRQGADRGRLARRRPWRRVQGPDSWPVRCEHLPVRHVAVRPAQHIPSKVVQIPCVREQEVVSPPREHTRSVRPSSRAPL